mmetsp:Transcript_74602/g.198185  ORF Transcript_74602/g.198185 Transcript_74602/m.198185 type:complete len:261 (-) Transcript_74602:1672-2454(-)
MRLQHRLDDDVGRAALHRRVDRLALRAPAHGAFLPTRAFLNAGPPAPALRLALWLVEPQVLNHARAPPQRDHVGALLLLGLLDDPRLPHLDLGVRLVPLVDHLLGLPLLAPKLRGKTYRREAVGYPEVDGLGVPPLRPEAVFDQLDLAFTIGRHLEEHLAALHRLAHMAVHVHRGVRVEVDAAAQRLDHVLALAYVREDSDVQLTVVRHDHALRLAALDRAANLVLVPVQRWQLLEVRVATRQASGGGVDVEGAVQAAGG